MIEVIIFLMSLFCTNPNHANGGAYKNGQVSTFDTGGETGDVPPGVFTPPPPPHP